MSGMSLCEQGQIAKTVAKGIVANASSASDQLDAARRIVCILGIDAGPVDFGGTIGAVVESLVSVASDAGRTGAEVIRSLRKAFGC